MLNDEEGRDAPMHWHEVAADVGRGQKDGIVLASYPMKNLQRSEQASPHLFIVSISSSPLIAGRFVAIHHPLSHRPPLDEVERALGVTDDQNLWPFASSAF
jgi:hypothetical protein